jgi:hypothetical protein
MTQSDKKLEIKDTTSNELEKAAAGKFVTAKNNDNFEDCVKIARVKVDETAEKH